jgi:hypothetical protein
MLLAADSSWTYIQLCHNIYCLRLSYCSMLQTNTILTLPTVSHIPPAAPPIPPPPTQHQHWLPQARWQLVVRGGEKKIINNLDTQRSDGTYHTGTSAGWQAETERMWYESTKIVRNWTQCTVQHTHTPVHKSPPQNTHLLLTLHSPH